MPVLHGAAGEKGGGSSGDDPFGPPPPRLIFPDQLTPALGEILGLMPWITGNIARGLRDAGVAEIPRKCEAEQAYVLHWLITLALEHGADWRRVAGEELRQVRELLGAGEARA